MLSIENFFNYKDIDKLKAKKLKKYDANTMQKNAEVAILI